MWLHNANTVKMTIINSNHIKIHRSLKVRTSLLRVVYLPTWMAGRVSKRGMSWLLETQTVSIRTSLLNEWLYKEAVELMMISEWSGGDTDDMACAPGAWLSHLTCTAGSWSCLAGPRVPTNIALSHLWRRTVSMLL